MKSVDRDNDRIAEERKVSVEGGCPALCGGQGSSALSVPMREDSPAARITPAKLGARDMLRKIAESERKVSARRYSVRIWGRYESEIPL
jgi:hypothetical protein